MASFKNGKKMFLLGVEEEIIDQEFVLIYEAFLSQNLSFTHWGYEKFCLEDKNCAECKADFRFEKRDIPLWVPPTLTCQQERFQWTEIPL